MMIAPTTAPPVHAGAAAEYFAATSRVADSFFTERADDIATACLAMASCFANGGRMFVCGDGAQRSDVAHVVVEFIHPVVVGKHALPALALPDIENGAARKSVSVMARRADLLLLLAPAALSDAALGVLASAREEGLTTIVLAGETAAGALAIDHLFAVPSLDAFVVQETHEMLYHILWELVHVFLDHRTPGAGHV